MAKGFKHGAGGGGASLNFKVVGNPKPENPKANTIWVDTDVEITGWDFSAAETANPVEGMVWFSTGASSSVAFNALKKNGITVYPLSAKQYVGGAWVDKTAKSYQSGAWVDWVTYLYKNGNTFDDITGGLDVLAISGTFWKKSDVTFDSDRIIFNSTPNTACVSYVTTKKKIDLTNQNSIVLNSISFTATGQYARGRLGATSTKADYTSLHDNAVALKEFGIGTTGEVILDVSSLSGEYYVAFGISSESSGGRLEVSEVRME